MHRKKNHSVVERQVDCQKLLPNHFGFKPEITPPKPQNGKKQSQKESWFEKFFVGLDRNK